jgi:macrolide transport system ATP-binding/permease protein
MQLNLSNIHFGYAESPREVLSGVTVTFPEGWTGVVGDNGCGKSTLARIATGELAPDQGTVSPELVSAYCEQDVSVAPEGMVEFACSWERDAVRLRAQLGIGDDWVWRFDELSCGQRKRLQVAVALWRRPDVLVCDEPTNHLDAPARSQVLEALRGFRGIGILISHDRELLDALVERCLMFGASGPVMRPGTYSQAAEQEDVARASAIAQRTQARREERRLRDESQRRAEEASRSAGMRSRRGLAAGDHDAREKIGRAIASGKDARATHAARLMRARADEAAERSAAAFVERRYDGDVPDYGERSRRDVLVRVEEGVVPFGEVPGGPGVRVSALYLGSADHVGIVGPNGTGKSTLVRAIMRALPADVPHVYVPQELAEEDRARLLDGLDALSAGERGQVLSIVAQLNSRPEAILEGGPVSPGELRKLAIAEGALLHPQLLVMDEPTNHLDLHSVEALERFLAGFVGAIVLVSHDVRAISAACDRVWELVPNPESGGEGSVLVER